MNKEKKNGAKGRKEKNIETEKENDLTTVSKMEKGKRISKRREKEGTLK
jgi:hypothetical protein